MILCCLFFLKKTHSIHMKSIKKIKLKFKYDFSYLLKPLMLLSFLSVITYGAKLLGAAQADKVFFVLILLVITPIVLNHIHNSNYKLSFMLVLFILIILYLYVYDDLLVFLVKKCRNNGIIFGVVNSIFNTFGLTDFENLVYYTSYGGAKLIHGEIVTGAVDIFKAKLNSSEASMYLAGRYFSLFSALGIAFSVKKHKKAILFISVFTFLSGNFTVFLMTLLLVFTPYYFIFLLFVFISYFISNVVMIKGGFAVNSSIFELFVYCDNYVYILAVGIFLCAVSYYISRLAKEKLKW